jgi:hypothetical protein
MKNNKTQEDLKNIGRNFWLGGIGAIVAGVTIGFGILFWYTPRVYRPDLAGDSEGTSLYLTHELGPEFFNQLQLNEPFELIISQDGLNELINQWDWPQQLGEMSFDDPYVIFSEQSILLMSTFSFEGVSSVLSISAFPTMNRYGTLNTNIESVRLGMVPVKTLITRLAQKAFDKNRSRFEQDLKTAENIQAIIRNEPVDPIFWFPDRWIRITGFSFNNGALSLKLSPVEN